MNFWICMYNNAIDIAVLDWFHLFGSHSDDLHWKRVVDGVEWFRQGLLSYLGIELKAWKDYREEVKIYRDKDVAHMEVRPVSHIPEMELALKAACFYYRHILSELKGYSSYAKWPDDLAKYHVDSLKHTMLIVEAACEATSHLSEEVY